MLKKMMSVILALILATLTLTCDAYAIETDETQVSELDAMMQSYVRVITFAEGKGISLCMSLDEYVEVYEGSTYGSITEYEQATMSEIALQDAPCVENGMDKSPLDYVESKALQDDDSLTSEKVENDITDGLTPNVGELENQPNLSKLHESYERVQEYLKESGVNDTLPFSRFELLFNENDLSIEDFENFMYGSIDNAASIQGSWLAKYYNNCTSLPDEAYYTSYNLLADVSRGDIFYERNGIASLTGHIGIIVGHYYDTRRKLFYLKCVEAIQPGVKYGIVDDGRVDEGGFSIYRVNATSKQRDSAVAFCTSQLNKNWSIIGMEKKTVSSEHWYCSELVWAGYKREGIDLDSGSLPGVEPDEIRDSPKLSKITISSSSRPSNVMNDFSSHWGYTAIRFAVDNGLIKSYTPFSYKPDGNASRAVCVYALYRMGNGDPYYSNNPFSDVSSTSYYRDAVAWAYAKK